MNNVEESASPRQNIDGAAATSVSSGPWIVGLTATVLGFGATAVVSPPLALGLGTLLASATALAHLTLLRREASVGAARIEGLERSVQALREEVLASDPRTAENVSPTGAAETKAAGARPSATSMPTIPPGATAKASRTSMPNIPPKAAAKSSATSMPTIPPGAESAPSQPENEMQDAARLRELEEEVERLRRRLSGDSEAAA